ncbi:MAG: protein-glutamate O-methyltransferase CheR [Gammaproteobacteria bacterium]|nr:protein-glutamate O-methyltransferase CheR [Gammaproteobacteria bacterium]NNJ49664.1 protein-glutamate O-methyltransferase CheR [Gammaproteobacteria bacterium]
MKPFVHNIDKEFIFTDEDFIFLSQLAAQHAGINLTEDKRELVYGRVAKRLRILNIDNFKEYCSLLRQEGNEESGHFINSITTNVTSFFRENHHFEHLANNVIPEIIRKNANAKLPRLRIWSAGCSTGKEPYSIAMVLREKIDNIDCWDAKILATDLDSDVLHTAEQAIYPIDGVDQVSDERKKKWMLMGTGDNASSVKIKKEIRDLVYFKQLNLTEQWPIHGTFDCIFFRNVAIYFKRPTQVNILNRFADCLDSNGTLFVGHSESLIGLSERYINTGQTIHQKIA